MSAKRPAKPAGHVMHWRLVGTVRAVDGDTVAADAMHSVFQGPHGMGVYIAPAVIRLARIQAPEMRSGRAGEASKRNLAAWIGLRTKNADVLHEGLTVITTGKADDKYGRIGAEIVDADGEAASDHQLTFGYATRYTS